MANYSLGHVVMKGQPSLQARHQHSDSQVPRCMRACSGLPTRVWQNRLSVTREEHAITLVDRHPLSASVHFVYPQSGSSLDSGPNNGRGLDYGHLATNVVEWFSSTFDAFPSFSAYVSLGTRQSRIQKARLRCLLWKNYPAHRKGRRSGAQVRP